MKKLLILLFCTLIPVLSIAQKGRAITPDKKPIAEVVVTLSKADSTFVKSVATDSYSQVEMRGTITSTHNDTVVPVEFADIALYRLTDTTKAVTGTVSDFNGRYLIENVSAGNYKLVIKCLGYSTLYAEISVEPQAEGKPLVADYSLVYDSQQLTEVTVSGSLRHQYIDKAVYTFTTKDVKAARYSKDLLKTLPELTIDAQSKNLTTLNGKSLLILINGVAATDNELKMLPPDKVLRVEYYDFPPARYAGVGAVVNMITREPQNGYSGGVDLAHAFTTGFGEGNLYFNYNSGRSQFAIDYHLSYRSYKKRESETLYSYELNNESRHSQYLLRDTFGYTVNTVGLRYTNRLTDNYIFQATLRPDFTTYFAHGVSNINNIFGNDTSVYTSRESKTFLTLSPVLDLYFWKLLPKNSDIAFNLVGTMFWTNQKESKYEYRQPSGTQTLGDEMTLDNRKQSLIGEVVYTRKLSFASWNSGYKIDISWLRSDIKNLFGKYDYNSNSSTQYLYSELSGSKNKLLYRLSLGAKYIINQSYSNKYNRLVFAPMAMVGYNINDGNTFRLMFRRNTRLPSVSELSNNARVVTPDIIYKGNPLLTNATVNTSSLSYTHKNPILTLNIELSYQYVDKAINKYFAKDPSSPYIALTNENAKYSQEFGGELSFSLKPFGSDILKLQSYTQLMYQNINSGIVGNLSNWYFPINLAVSSQIGKCMLAYQYRFTSMSINGAFLNRDENQSHVTVYYQLNDNLQFTANMLWTFMPSQYFRETLTSSLVYQLATTKIWDNRSMILIGVSWNFHKGKDYDIRRKLQNKDYDSGRF